MTLSAQMTKVDYTDDAYGEARAKPSLVIGGRSRQEHPLAPGPA